MKTLLSTILIAGTLMSINVNADELEKSAEQLMDQQIAQVNLQLANQISQDIKFATYTMKMPVVAEQKVLLAQTKDTSKKQTDSE